MYSIVIADDETNICHGLQSVIAGYLPECTVAEVFQNGARLLEYLQSNPPDILIVDIEMPGATGLEIARHVSDHHLPTYIIMITAHYNFEYAQRAVKYHVHDFITKPYSADELIEAIRAGIRSVSQAKDSADHRISNLRSVLRSIVSLWPLQQAQCQDIYLCNGSVSILALACTEILFSDINIASLPAEEARAFKLQMRSCAEWDSFTQSSFILDYKSGSVTLLIFHKGAPELSFLKGTETLLNRYASLPVSYTEKTFASFPQYYLQKQFEREMNLAMLNYPPQESKQAKMHLTGFLSSLSPGERDAFSDYLAANHQLSLDFSDSSALPAQVQQLFSLLSTDSSDSQMDAILDYIAGHYSSAALSRETVAAFAGISVSHFTRLFNKNVQQSFSSYLIQLRMEKAAQLLLSTDLPTVQIAQRVGFYNPEYFRTSFARYYGMTPRKFRLSRHADRKETEK